MLSRAFRQGLFLVSIGARPRRRRLEAFTTDAKSIRLISRRVADFSDGGGAAVFRRRLRHRWVRWFEKFTGVIPRSTTPWAPRKKDGSPPRCHNPAYAIALTVSSLSLKIFSRISDLQLQSTYSSLPAFIIIFLHQACDQFQIYIGLLKLSYSVSTCTERYSSFIARNYYQHKSRK